MLEITLIQDLSRKNLREVPESILNLKNLKMLYLEGNDIEDIPQELFVLLDKLQWLDLRNNKLATVPKTVMNHRALETLLLQNNDIEHLPLELGFVPNLKVLQLSGNPLKFPKKPIIDSGLCTLKQFLQKEYRRRVTKDDSTTETEYDHMMPSTPEPSTSATTLTETENDSFKHETPVITLKSFNRLNNRKQQSKSKMPFYKRKSKYSIYKETPYCNSNKYVQSCSSSQNIDRIQKQIIKDLFMNEMKNLVSEQEEIIQREKNREARRRWRYNPKYRHNSANLDYRPTRPYDYDDEYDQMPSRESLYNFVERSTSSMYNSHKPKKINIESLISEIVESLKFMGTERNVEKTPRTRMNIAGKEIQRILDLQKRLSALKLTNDRTL